MKTIFIIYTISNTDAPFTFSIAISLVLFSIIRKESPINPLLALRIANTEKALISLINICSQAYSLLVAHPKKSIIKSFLRMDVHMSFLYVRNDLARNIMFEHAKN